MERSEPATLVVFFIMPKLLLQSPPLANGKGKKDLLENWLNKWKGGYLQSLVDEGRMVQKLHVRKKSAWGSIPYIGYFSTHENIRTKIFRPFLFSYTCSAFNGNAYCE